MEQLIQQFSSIGRGMWRYRWPAVIVAWVVAVIGATVVMRVPDRYEASARIYVDTQSILKPLMSGLTVQPNVDQQLAMLSRTLISRPNVEKLIRMADLDLDLDRESGSRAREDALADSLMKTLRIGSTNRDNLYTLSFQDRDPDKAQRVIQSLVSIFIESSVGANRKDADAAKVFINEQIRSYQAKLEEAEARLKAFRLRNIDLQTRDGVDLASRLGEVSAQLEKARLELREAENARDAARSQLEAEKGLGEDLATQSLLMESSLAIATPEIDARIEAQRQQLDMLLLRYTDRHPQVVSTQRILRDLESQKVRETQERRLAALAAPKSGPDYRSSLVYQELNRIHAAAEVQVAALKVRVAEHQARHDRALALMKQAPQIEAEAARLNRDYAIHKKNYEDLVARREAAAISGELEGASGLADFRLIDPPRVAPQPVSPKRQMLLSLVLVAALGGGLATAFAASQLRPVFHLAGEVRERLNLPVLGVVSMYLGDADRRREKGELMRFTLASSSLVILFAAGMAALTLTSAR